MSLHELYQQGQPVVRNEMSITINKKGMEDKVINQRQAIKMLKLAQDISSYEVKLMSKKLKQERLFF